MLCYKDQRFHVCNVSFQIPDGYFLDTEPGEEADNCIRLWDPAKCYLLVIRVDADCSSSEMELASVLQGIKPTILRPASPVSINGISGHHATYRHTRTQYYEMWLDIDEGVTMLVLIVTKEDILRIDTAAVVASIDPRMNDEKMP